MFSASLLHFYFIILFIFFNINIIIIVVFVVISYVCANKKQAMRKINEENKQNVMQQVELFLREWTWISWRSIMGCLWRWHYITFQEHFFWNFLFYFILKFNFITLGLSTRTSCQNCSFLQWILTILHNK